MPRKAEEIAVPADRVPMPARPVSVEPTEDRDRFGTLPAALRYLNSRANIERLLPTRIPPGTFKLDRMRAIMRELGDPQNMLRCVHVAGSKGKGSTTEMIASALAGCGYATGVYTSPHLVDVRERIRINGDPIGPTALARLMGRVADAADTVAQTHGEVTYFEVLTAVALLYFFEQAVDVAVIEVGIGGRLDSTNVIVPEVALVTEIHLEHTAILGNELSQIAREKAGIFKPGVPAITIQQSPEVIATLRAVADEVGAPLHVVGQDIEFTRRFEASPELGPHVRVCLSTARSSYEHFPVPLKGEHQAGNCGLALAAIDTLRGRGFNAPEVQVAEGLARTLSHGRMEVVCQEPRILIDGAHTPESITALMRTIGSYLRYDSLVVIFGCAVDKEIAGMLRGLELGADKVIFTRAATPGRAADPETLQRLFADASGRMAQVTPSVPDAIRLAGRAVARDDLICVTGSFLVAGEAKRFVQDLRARAERA